MAVITPTLARRGSVRVDGGRVAVALALLLALTFAAGPVMAQTRAVGADTKNRASMFDGIWVTDESVVPAKASMLPAVQAKFDAIRPQDDPGARCVELGTSRFMRSPSPMEIVAMDDHLLMVLEYYHAVRRIWTDAKAHDPDPDPGFYGDSVVHWDGDTMVVDTIGYNGEQWLDAFGHPSSPKTHIVERWTLLNPDHIKVEMTYDDPTLYAAPWTVVETYSRKPHWKLQEMSCDKNRADPTDPRNDKAFTSTDAPAPYVGLLPPGKRPK